MITEFEATNLRLESCILECLREYGLFEIAVVKVRVRHGVAYIGGSVPNLRLKRLTKEIVGKVEGITNVVCMLRIAPSSFVKDECLRMYISQDLTINPKIDETNIWVQVTDGIVYLGGSTSTVVEKRFVEDQAWATPGVRDIVNKIEVVSAIEKSNTQIASDILQGFSDCLGLDRSKVVVEIEDGTAFLRGVVPNDYLKSAAEELARWTPQVSDVSNELKVLSQPGSRAKVRLS